MAVVNDLVVRLFAETQQFRREMGRAARQTRQFQDKVGRVAQGAAAFTAIAVAARATVGVVRSLSVAFRRTADEIDRTVKLSRTLGTSMETLEGLRVGGAIQGIADQTVQTAMIRLTRRIQDAADGGREYGKALQKAGLDAEKLAELPLDDQLLLIADAFQNLRSQGEKAQFAFKLFDREGVELLRFFEQGRGTIEAFNREARDFGLILSEDRTRAIESMNDELTELRLRVDGVSRQVTGTFAPAVDLAIQGLNDLIGELQATNRAMNFLGGGDVLSSSILGAFFELGNAFKARLTLMQRDFTRLLAGALDFFADLERGFRITTAALKAIWGDFGTFFELSMKELRVMFLDTMLGATNSLLRVLDRLQGPFDAMKSSIQAIGNIIASQLGPTEGGILRAIIGNVDPGLALRSLKAGIQSVKTEILDLNKAASRDLGEFLERNTDAVARWEEAIDEAGRAADAGALRTAADAAEQVLAEMVADAEKFSLELGQGFEKAREFIRLIRSLSAGGEAGGNRVRNLNDELDATQKLVGEIGNSLASNVAGTFADIVTGARRGREAFADLARSAARFVVQLLLMRAIQAGLSGLSRLGGGIGDLFAAFGGTGITRAQHGAVVRSDSILRAGESGPEAVVPLPDVPSGQGAQAAAGGGNTIIFNVNTPNAESFRRTRRQIRDMLESVNSA